MMKNMKKEDLEAMTRQMQNMPAMPGMGGAPGTGSLRLQLALGPVRYVLFKLPISVAPTSVATHPNHPWLRFDLEDAFASDGRRDDEEHEGRGPAVHGSPDAELASRTAPTHGRTDGIRPGRACRGWFHAL